MADDANSDFVANAAEQKVIRNRRKFALRISRSRIEEAIPSGAVEYLLAMENLN